MLAAFVVAAFMLRCMSLVHHHLEARAVTKLAAKDSFLLIECKCLECSPFGITFFLSHLALAFVAFMVAAFVIAFAFLTFMVAAFMIAFAFLAFVVAAFVFAFAFLAFMFLATFMLAALMSGFHLGFLSHALLNACLCHRHSCCLLSLVKVVPTLESVDDAFNLSSVFGCHLMALRSVMMVALFFLVLAVAFALCVFFVFFVTLTVAA